MWAGRPAGNVYLLRALSQREQERVKDTETGVRKIKQCLFIEVSMIPVNKHKHADTHTHIQCFCPSTLHYTHTHTCKGLNI